MSLICFTVCYNRPRYIPYQYECLKKFIDVPFEYIVFDNSPDNSLHNEFSRITHYLGIRHVRIPQDIHNIQDPSNRAGKSLDYAIQYMYENMEFRGVVMLNDSDLFLTNSYNPITRLGENDFIGLKGKHYINQFFIANFNKLNSIRNLSFLPCVIDGVNYDCGGLTIKYFDEHPEIKHSSITQHSSGTFNASNIDSAPDKLRDYLKEEIKIFDSGDYAGKAFSEIFDESFIHLRSGSNWYGHNDKITFNREDNLFTFLCNKLIDWNISKDENNKYIIAFSLFGTLPKYRYNAIINALLAKKIYKGWICRYYVDSNDIPDNIINILESFDNTEVIKLESNDFKEKYFWRFYTASDPNVAVMISRDADAWLSFREAYSVKKWIESDKKFHIMRDHCYHGKEIMAGMWGIKRGVISNMQQLCEEYYNYDKNDQTFLAKKIYPNILDTVMVHYSKEQIGPNGAPTYGYFPDGGIPFERYPKILEYIPTLDIEKENYCNRFGCAHCGKDHGFFIGEMFNNSSNERTEFIKQFN